MMFVFLIGIVFWDSVVPGEGLVLLIWSDFFFLAAYT
jgi:hypothetical protein